MTSLEPRSPYTPAEIEKLYPKNLELELVQVLLRHGERAPVSARFQNAGLAAYWPYCEAAKRMRSTIYAPGDATEWSSLEWRRRIESFSETDSPALVRGPGSEIDSICLLGQLTDKGRQTTHDLGARLRHLYIDQLNFMPSSIVNADMIYLRATHMPRALESVQETFWGMYPPTTRSASVPPPTIVTRAPVDETLYPNTSCKRFGELFNAFGQRAADHWNNSEDLQYVTSKIGKWMPEDSKKVQVDSHPRLSGVMDTINSTLGHGPETRLPSEFYDARLRSIIERIGNEEWFAGYKENREYRRLGSGALAGDIVERMTSKIEHTTLTVAEIGSEDGKSGPGRGGDTSIKFALSGCHDTTLAGMLASLGAFDTDRWPPYTSHIAFELLKTKDASPQPQQPSPTAKPGWVASLLGLFSSPSLTRPTPIGRTPYTSLTSSQKSHLSNRYVRVRYNDTPVTIPACKQPGNHFEGDETLCTFEAFKRVVDGFTPKSWKGECGFNLGKEMVGVKGLEGVKQPAGLIEEGF